MIMRTLSTVGVVLVLLLNLRTVAADQMSSPHPEGLLAAVPSHEFGAYSKDAGIVPVGLKTEYATRPLGIDTPSPRLSWMLQPVRPELRGQMQTAYQVIAASSPELLEAGRADVWDSGKVDSKESIHIVYNGRPLRSGERVFWNVRVWDEEGRVSEPSATAWWEMALLNRNDWNGIWIKGTRPTPQTEEEWYGDNPAPLIRTSFAIADTPITRARIYVTGLGYYELTLNGEPVGDRVLDPGWTDYAERVLYSVFDVTELLRRGENALGLMLGNGWYNPLPLKIFGRWQLRDILPVGDPKAILQLDIEYEDGTTQSVYTDTSWKTVDGPIIKNNIYLGEIYDARREQPGWDMPGFNDSGWEHALQASPPEGTLRVQDIPPIKVMRTIKPVEIIERDPRVYIFDMGQNFAGWITLRVEGARGDSVVMRFGELLHDDGNINVLTSTMTQIKDWNAVAAEDWDRVLDGRFWNEGPYVPETAWQSDTYILKGEGVETYTPSFTFHGFRYVEVRGFPGTPTLDALEGHLLRSAVDYAGSFSSSNELFNETQKISMWALESNMFSVQSDCPHRERFGYGGDIVAASEFGLFNLDMAQFYAKTVHDFADAVRPNGGFTEIAPHVGIDVEGLGEEAGPVGWGTAHPMLVSQLYRYYGNRRLMEQEYERVRRWADLLEENAVDGILDNGISDHASVAPKPKALTGTAFYYYNTRLVAEFAEILGRDDDAVRYRARAADVKDAFNRRFLDEASGRYYFGTQATQNFALYFDLVPDEHRLAVLRRLVHDLQHHDMHLSTGIFGTKYLFNVLTEHGLADLAYQVANKRTFPSYGHMIANGATTLWEHWFEPGQESHNHPMFGSVSEWYYKAILGIRPEQDAVGFDRFILQPHVLGDMKSAHGYYDSIRGRIESSWMVLGDRLVFETTVPVSTSATMFLPARSREDVEEGGRQADSAPGVTFLRMDENGAVYRLGSGRYRFIVRDFIRK